MRILSWLLPACLALSACNMAVSDHSMFSNEPRSTLKLKDGLWVADDPDCKFDRGRPIHRWPKCAAWLLIRDNGAVQGPDSKPGERLELTIADGDPPILEAATGDEQKGERGYAYLVLEPASSDSTGYVVDLRAWFIACGTWDEGSAREGTASQIKHFPGMDEDCHPASVDVLRAAARAGPQGQDKKARWFWIRANVN